MWQANQTNGNQFNPGNFTFSGAYTQSNVGDSTTGLAYADFMLGQVNAWSASVQPESGARMKMPQMFIQDDIKLRPNFTLNVGIRYQIFHGWNEVKNNIAAFDPEVFNPAAGANGAIWYASTGAHGRRSLEANVLGTVLPRVGFNWAPNPTTTVRGGFGIYSYDWSTNVYGGGLGNASYHPKATQPTRQMVSHPLSSFRPPARTFLILRHDRSNRAQWAKCDLHAISHPYSEDLSVERCCPAYTGLQHGGRSCLRCSHGFNLNFPVDINQVPESLLAPDDSPNSRPYPIYESISGSTNNAISNYNSLQASIIKRLASGLSLEFNYVWSHFLDDQDSAAENGIGGTQIFQNSYAPSANYGSSNFDARNAFKGNVVYQLPIGKARCS